MFKSINGGLLPQRATKYSAGFDVFANEDVVIWAGETKLIGLGIALDMENYADYYFSKHSKQTIEILKTQYSAEFQRFKSSHYFALHIRSSLRAKGLTSLGTGIIDMDYRDEIKMVIHNPIMIITAPLKGDSVFCEKKVHFDSMHTIKKGDKIGQLILCRHEGWLLPSEYTKDEERNGGFGSTGK